MNKNTEWAMPVTIIFLAMMSGFIMGHNFGRSVMKQSAVEAGVGHYVISNTNSGATHFEWITNSINNQ